MGILTWPLTQRQTEHVVDHDTGRKEAVADLFATGLLDDAID